MRRTQRKGDLAVAQAIFTFTQAGIDVSLPITESAAYDIVVDISGQLKRVQVKFTGGVDVDLRSIHSNSLGYVVKKPERNSFDWLFVLTGEGKEYLITHSVSGRRSIKPIESQLFENVWRGGRVV